jgi:hypothetical protein
MYPEAPPQRGFRLSAGTYRGGGAHPPRRVAVGVVPGDSRYNNVPSSHHPINDAMGIMLAFIDPT